MTNLSKGRPSAWLAALCAALPWLVLMVVAGYISDAEASSSAALNRQSTLEGALLAASSSVFCVAFAAWGRSAGGRSIVAALGAHADLLMLGCSFALGAAMCFTVLGGGRLGPVGNAIMTASLVWLVWLMGSISLRVPRNRLIGFRTRRTLANESTWRSVNDRHGRRLRALAFIGLAGVLVPPYGPLIALMPAVAVGVSFLVEEARSASPE